MKYKDFIAAKAAWTTACSVVSQFRFNQDCQIVATTSAEDEALGNYWLMQKIDGQDAYLMAWCYDRGEPQHEDVSFGTLDEVKEWLFEQITDGIIHEVWCESM